MSLTLCLVIAGDRGPQLVFRFPPKTAECHAHSNTKIALGLHGLHYGSTSGFSVPVVSKDEGNAVPVTYFQSVFTFSPIVFAKTFFVKPEVCGKLLDVTIDEKQYISFPMLVPIAQRREVTFFNIVFVLDANDVDAAVYKDIVMKLSKAILHEELHRSYLSLELQKMQTLRDELQSSAPVDDMERELFFIRNLLSASVLAHSLSELQINLTLKGSASLLLNGWMELQFSLHDLRKFAQDAIRPYQTLLLIDSRDSLLSSLPVDCSQALRLLILHASPRKSFQELSNELDIPLFQMYRMAAHLVYWKKARIIDTLAKSNIYVLHPDCKIQIDSPLFAEFSHHFSAHSLTDILLRFSTPLTLAEHLSHFLSSAQLELIEIIGWLLKRQCIMQLFQFIYLIGTVPVTPYQLHSHPSLSTPASPSLGPSMPFTIASPRNVMDLSKRSISSPHLFALAEKDVASAPSLKLAASIGYLPALLSLNENAVKKVSSSGNINAVVASSGSAIKRKMSFENAPNGLAGPDAAQLLFTLFKRLCAYFDGKHHMQEIMWIENVSRRELNTILHVYSDVLTRVLHE